MSSFDPFEGLRYTPTYSYGKSKSSVVSNFPVLRGNLVVDSTKINSPTNKFSIGDSVKISSGKIGTVIRVSFNFVFVEIDNKILGFEPRFVEKNIG